MCADPAAPNGRPGYVVYYFGHGRTGEIYAQGHGGCAWNPQPIPARRANCCLPKLGMEHGLTVGEDWFLAFSPERVDPGREDCTTINTPKVVGGITEACGEVATAWYEGAIKTVHHVSTAEAAEMSKLLENTFRMINIGLVNELAIMCERLGVDVWEVIDAAASKPFGFMKFTPGPGLGRSLHPD